MKSSARKVELASVDDLFSTEESRQDAAREKVMDIALSELFPFEGHPFSVRDDDAMKETVESVKEYGILSPAIARPREGGGYELVSGHRRKRACELAGLESLKQSRQRASPEKGITTRAPEQRLKKDTQTVISRIQLLNHL